MHAAMQQASTKQNDMCTLIAKAFKDEIYKWSRRKEEIIHTYNQFKFIDNKGNN